MPRCTTSKLYWCTYWCTELPLHINNVRACAPVHECEDTRVWERGGRCGVLSESLANRVVHWCNWWAFNDIHDLLDRIAGASSGALVAHNRKEKRWVKRTLSYFPLWNWALALL